MDDESVQKYIAQLIADNRVMLFMKGNKLFPQCGFSGAVLEILKRSGVPFGTFNVLRDPAIREADHAICHRGGDGVVRRVRFLEPMEVNVLSSHRAVPPYGLDAGGEGQVGVNRVIRSDGSTTEFGAVVSVEVEPGDCFELETPGGGGWSPT